MPSAAPARRGRLVLIAAVALLLAATLVSAPQPGAGASAGLPQVAATDAAADGSAGSTPLIRIDDVTFRGTSEHPTLIIVGVGFGATPPPSWPADRTSCGDYVDNGRWYGDWGLWYRDNTWDWIGGTGKEDVGACVGIKVSTWSPTRVTLTFGSAYHSYAHWWLEEGDNFVIAVRKRFFGGVVHF